MLKDLFERFSAFFFSYFFSNFLLMAIDLEHLQYRNNVKQLNSEITNVFITFWNFSQFFPQNLSWSLFWMFFCFSFQPRNDFLHLPFILIRWMSMNGFVDTFDDNKCFSRIWNISYGSCRTLLSTKSSAFPVSSISDNFWMHVYVTTEVESITYNFFTHISFEKVSQIGKNIFRNLRFQ